MKITITIDGKDKKSYAHVIPEEVILRCWTGIAVDKLQDTVMREATEWFTKNLMISLFEYRKHV